MFGNWIVVIQNPDYRISFANLGLVGYIFTVDSKGMNCCLLVSL